jgi:uncharacterized protein (DUF1697 family)
MCGARIQSVTVFVGLLRGINVGKHNRLAMAQLRAIAEECGCTDVVTYIQSGNLVFDYSGEDPAGTLENHILQSTGIATSVIIRTADEIAGIVDANPFLDRSDDPTHHHVVCASTDLAGALDTFDLDAYHPESAFISGRELYLYLPGGMGASKLAVALTRRPSTPGTTRNWRTMTKLMELSGEHPGPPGTQG